MLLRATAATIKQFTWIVLVLANISAVSANDVPFLERPVTINADNQTFAEIFKIISKQTGVVFSYNAEQFDDRQRTSINIYNKPLRVVLNALLKPTHHSYKLKKKYIIIKYKGQKAQPKKSTLSISGYLISAADSSRINDASIFIKTTRESAITDSFGYFQLAVSNTTAPLSLSFAKENFTDTALIISNPGDKELWIVLSPKIATPILYKPLPGPAVKTVSDSIPLPELPLPDSTAKDTLSPLGKFWQRQNKLNANLRNIRDTLFTKASFSLVPPISTNKLLSYNTINNFSFNVLIGKSKGIDGFELGGLFNYDIGNVQYAQIAGLGNIVGGDVKYVQVGGIFNMVSGGGTGIQVGGIFNMVKQKVDGVQVGGVFNHAKSVDGLQIGGIYNLANTDVKGLQVGGVFNYAKNIDGLQIGGLCNLTKDTLRSLQVGGALNMAQYAEGVQLSGLMNAAKDIKGVQIAGAVNIAKQIDGVQVAGLVNYAKVITGAQIALFNFSDSSSGVPIGIFSYVNKGYHKTELYFDELKLTTLGIRSGVEKFHNILFAGYNGFGDRKFWTYGYGIGCYKKITLRKGVVFDLTAQQLQDVNPGEIKLNILSRFNISYSYSIAKKFSIALGPTLNLFQQDITDNSFIETFKTIAPTTFFNTTIGTTQSTMWAGAKASFKFL